MLMPHGRRNAFQRDHSTSLMPSVGLLVVSGQLLRRQSSGVTLFLAEDTHFFSRKVTNDDEDRRATLRNKVVACPLKCGRPIRSSGTSRKPLCVSLDMEKLIGAFCVHGLFQERDAPQAIQIDIDLDPRGGA